MNLLRFCKNLYASKSKFREFLNEVSLSVFEEHPGHTDVVVQKHPTNSDLDKVILNYLESNGINRCDFCYKNRTITFFSIRDTKVYSLVNVNLCKKKDIIKVNSILEFYQITPINITLTSTPGTYHKKVKCTDVNIPKINEVFITPGKELISEEDLTMWILSKPSMNYPHLDDISLEAHNAS